MSDGRKERSGFTYINKTYGLSIGRGTRVTYTGDKKPWKGRVTSTRGAHIMILFDGDKRARGPFHPTWELLFYEARP